jgi:hypothetical protein
MEMMEFFLSRQAALFLYSIDDTKIILFAQNIKNATTIHLMAFG